MLRVLKQAFRDFNDDECPTRAAALAYYTVFSLPPLLVLVTLAAGAIWDPREVHSALQGQFVSLLGSDAAAAISRIIAQGSQSGSRGVVATMLGIGALLFGATGAFVQLQDALNHAWEVKPDPKRSGIRNFLGKRLLSLGMVLGIAFLLIVSLAVSALISAVGSRLAFVPEQALHAANFVLSFAVTTLLFAAIFKLLPDATIAWRDVWTGAIATSFLFVLGTFLIGLYLGRSEPGSAYGAASVLAVILVWVYYAGMIVLFGAEFTQAWVRRRGDRIQPGAVRTNAAA